MRVFDILWCMENWENQKIRIIKNFDNNVKAVKKPDIKSISDKFDKKTEQEKQLEMIKNLPQVERVEALKKIGIITDLAGGDWGCLGGDRFYVFANINNVPVPMYKTSARTEGKREDRDFFPFFGAQTSHSDWLLKGDVRSGSNDFYGYKEIEEASRVLTEVFDFNTDRKKHVSNPEYDPSVDHGWERVIAVDNFIPDGKEIKSPEELNHLLEEKFGVDFNFVNSQPRYSNNAVKHVSDKIFSEIKR